MQAAAARREAGRKEDEECTYISAPSHAHYRATEAPKARLIW